MKKIFTLILLMTFGYLACLADNTYQAGPGSNTSISAGTKFVDNDYFSLSLQKKWDRDDQHTQPTSIPFPDGTYSASYGYGSIPMRYQSGNDINRIILEVKNTISNVKIYYQAPSANSESSRPIKVDKPDGTPVKMTLTEYENDKYLYPIVEGKGYTDFLAMAYIDNLPRGTYYIYCTGYSGAFIGINYTVLSNAGVPSNVTATGIGRVSSATTWDFSLISASNDLRLDNNYTQYTGYSYYYLASNTSLAYKRTFPGEYIAFRKEFDDVQPYAIKNNSYTEGGTLIIWPGTNGALKVTFSDPINDGKRKYLSINTQYGEFLPSSKYWVSQAEGQSEITTAYIPIEGNADGDLYYYIKGQDDNENIVDIRISKIEYIPMPNSGNSGSTEGVSDDLFTQRIFSHDSDGRSVSTWTFEGYRNGTHALVGGVEDNEIIYASSTNWPENGKTTDNTNGNIKFSIDTDPSHAYTHYMSCSRGSYVYIPVPAGSSGTIFVDYTQTENAKKTTIENIDFNVPGRWFYVCKSPDDNDQESKRLPMREQGSSYNFTSSDIVTYNDKTYLLLKGYYEQNVEEYIASQVTQDSNKDKYKGELKVLSFKVTLDKGIEYTFTLPEEDYDHQILGNHRHAIFNYTEGEVTNSSDHKSGSMTLQNGAKMTGVDHEDKVNSTTNVFHSFRDGDLVKYKTQYYGAIQMLSHTDYTITAPAGYYITTSVRVHGYNNKDTKADEQLETYVEYFNEGVYYDDFKNLTYDPNDKSKYEMEGLLDHTYLESLRDEEDAETTTLDFTTTATESLTFSFSGHQFLGVVDAVLVRKSEVPTLDGRLTYDLDKIHVDLNNYEKLGIGGTINYTPRANEELWWYFIPDAENAERDDYGTYGHRGCITREIKGKINSDDPNVTKTFSVRNFKFVNTAGSHETDESLAETYNNEGNFKKAQYLSSPDAINTLADATDGDGKVSLKITQGGKYYFYIRDTQTNLNSVLAVKTFDVSTGVEDVTIEDNYETDELYAPVYNIYGQRVDSSYRGIVIRNGRKYVQK